MPIPVDVVDSQLDWATFWISVVASLATLAAVVVAVVQTALARRDSIQARLDATAAREDAVAERELRHAAERQQRETALEASELLASTHHEIDRARRRMEQVEDAERRASRSAASVAVRSHWQFPGEGVEPITGDWHAFITVHVTVDAPLIENIEVFFERAADPSVPPSDVGGELQPVGRREVIRTSNTGEFEKMVYVFGLQYGDPLHCVVRFTDHYRDRWQLRTYDNSLVLLTRRSITPVDIEPHADR